MKLNLHILLILIRGVVYSAAAVAWWVVVVCCCCLMLLMIETWKRKRRKRRMKLNHLNETKKKKKKKMSVAFLAIVQSSVAPTPSTKRTYTQLKEDPLAKFNMALLQTTKRKRRRSLWVRDLCSACARQWLTLCFRFSWVSLGAWLRDRKKLTAVNSIKRERERKRHYLMTKKLERIKYGPKIYKERVREILRCHLKILKIPHFIRLSFRV